MKNKMQACDIFSIHKASLKSDFRFEHIRHIQFNHINFVEKYGA